MKSWKRIGACILTCSMLLNLCSPMTSVRATEVVDSGALTVHGNTSETWIWVKTATTERPTVNDSLTKVGGSGSLTINGSEAGYIAHENGIYFLIFDGHTFVDGDVITVKGQFQAPDGFIINIQETMFKYNSATTPKWTIYKEMTEVSSGAITIGQVQANRVWFNTETKSESLPFSAMSAVSGSGSITVNGVENSSAHLFHEDNVSGLYLIEMDALTFNAGDKVVIKGKFQTADGRFVIDMAETTFLWDGEKWSKLTTLTELVEGTTVIEPQETAGEGTQECQYVRFHRLSLVQTYTGADGTEKAWDIYIKPSETFAANADEGYTGLQISVKDKTAKETFAATFYNASHDGGTAFFRISEGRIPFDITEDTEVIIHAGEASSLTTQKQMKLVQDYILQIDVNENWTKPLYDGTKWEIHMETDGQFAGQEGEIFLWPAMVGDVSTTIEVSKMGTHFVLCPTSLQLPTDGTEGSLTVKAATVTGTAGSVITTALGKTLYVNKYGLQTDEPITPDTEDVGLTLMRTSDNNSKKGIYLHAMKEDAIPIDDSWAIRPVAVNGFVDGTYYFNHNSGLFIAGVNSNANTGSPLVEYIKVRVFYNAGIPEMAKYNEYYIGLSNVGDQITDGTIITLKGLFVYEGKLVEYLPTYFEWDEETTSWKVSMETTYVSGDVNGDGVADVKDLVRIKRYLGQKEEITYAIPEIPVSLVDADLIMEDDTYVVDDVDLQELRWQILGADEIELAAYCGPRREGYRYYADNDNDDGSDGNYDGNTDVTATYGTHPEDPEGGWEGWITEEDFQDYLNCGFTYLLPEQDAFYDFSYANGVVPVDSYYESDLYEYMELAEKMNIPVLVHANSMTAMSSDTDGVLTDSNKEFLSQLYRDLSKYEMFKGYSLADEPSYKSAGSFLETRKYLENLDPRKTFYNAFLPVTADNSLLAEGEAESKEAAYNAYMDEFYQATGTFTYDLYPLLTHTENGNRLDSNWLTNLQLTAAHAKNNQYDAGVVVQSTSYGIAKNYKLQEHPEYHRMIETKADVGFQVYTALAYGMKSIHYYTYWTHWTESARGIDSSAMVNYPTEADGEPVKTNAYYAVKAVNQEIKKFDHVFLNFDWQGTMVLTGDGATMSEVLLGALVDGSSYQPEGMTATATEETIIGCMKDANGREGYMIANATEPSANLTSIVTVTFGTTKKVLAYVNGTETEIVLTEGTCEFEVGAGEGIFVVPIS